MQNLTKRQIEIVELLKKGLTNHDICRILGISPNTVKVHLAKIYKILDVSNRTEAACCFETEEEKNTLTSSSNESPISIPQLIFFRDSSLYFNNLANHFYSELAKGIQQFEILQVIEEPGQISHPEHFYLKARLAGENNSDLLIELHHNFSSEIFWNESLHLLGDLGNALLIQRIAIKLYQKIESAASHLYQTIPHLQNHWWYATLHSMKSSMVRTKESWTQSIKQSELALEKSQDKILPAYSLGILWYKALLERWSKPEIAVSKIREYSANNMRQNPSSQHSLLLMSICQHLSNEIDASIKYLKKALDVNQINMTALQLLSQLQILNNQENDGLITLQKIRNLSPETIENPNNMTAEALIYFLTGKRDECIAICNEALFIMPELLVARLLRISAAGWNEKTKDIQEHISAFKKFHTNYNENDLAPVLQGIHSSKRTLLTEGLIKAGFLKSDLSKGDLSNGHSSIGRLSTVKKKNKVVKLAN